MVSISDSVSGDKAAMMAEAFAPLAARGGMALPESAVLRARSLYVGRERSRPAPHKLIPQLCDVLAGRDLLFRRNGEIVYRNAAEKKFDVMDAETFCTWLSSPNGGAVVLFSGYEKDAGPNGESAMIDGDLSVGQSRLVMKSVDFKMSLPELRKVSGVRLPFIGADGKMRLLEKGFDREAMTWTEDDVRFDTDLHLSDALLWLDGLTRTFGWRQKERDYAIWLAALVTMFGRGCFHGRAPAFFIGANLPESGKSLLTRLITFAVHGSQAFYNLEQDGEEELRKYLLSVARAGGDYVNFENIDWGGRELRLPMLDTFIESSEPEFRLMGGMKIERFKIDTIVLGSANNVTWSRDIQRRSLLCDLYNPLAGVDRVLPPDAKMIDANFWRDPQNRQMLLACCWSLVRSWDEAGRPKKPGRELGSFENWARFAPAVVWHVGQAVKEKWDCMMENTNDRVGDTRSRDWAALAKLAVAEFGPDPKTGMMRERFPVLVREFAGIARRNGIEAVCACLGDERSVEAVLACPGFKRPQKSAAAAPAEDVDGLWEDGEPVEGGIDPETLKAASEWLSGKAAGTLGKALTKELHERHFRTEDGSVWSFTSVKNCNPRRIDIEKVKG